MTDFFFSCYPWDLENEGVEAALSRLAGELGVDAVSVSALHRHVAEIRPRLTGGAASVEMEAGASFQPARQLYANARIRPALDAWIKSRNPVEKIAREAERSGLKLRLAMSACCNAALVARHPMAACVNAFGQASRRWLCPSNPDVREYIVAAAEDLANNYPAETIELWDAGFGGTDESSRFLAVGVLAATVEKALWSWCFCPSCRERAVESGVDAEEANKVVRDHLERRMRLEAGPAHSLAECMSASSSIIAYEGMRQEAVISLVRMVRSRVRDRLVVAVERDAAPAKADAAQGVDVAIRKHCDGILHALESDEASPDQPAKPERSRFAEDPRTDDMLCYCCPPRFTSGPALVAAVHDAARLGFHGIGFFNYGLAPGPCLEWVRQAVRYARRECAGSPTPGKT